MSKPCSQRDALFSRWTAAANTLSELEAMKTGAIREKDPGFGQWDIRLEEARNEERLAQREHERHLEIHGCNE